MDLSKIGQFIKQERKAKGITQQKLAEMLNVSEKTISKWECGNGFPDTTLILPLCKALNINANELLSGKRLDKKEYMENAESNILNLKNKSDYTTKKLLTSEIFVALLAVVLILIYVLVLNLIKLSVPLIVLFSLIVFPLCMLSFYFAIKIEQVAGYYMCKKCHHKYIPTYNQTLFSMHIYRTRFMKCPKCGKRSWNKKVINID